MSAEKRFTLVNQLNILLMVAAPAFVISAHASCALLEAGIVT